MNIRTILTGSIALATLVTTVKAADVEIRITGATAFRTATINALKASFDAGTGYTFAHNKAAGSSAYNGADRITFKGNFPGVTGTTTVRCSFNGSVEGIRAIALGGTDNPAFITDAALATPGTDASELANENANVTGSTTTQLAKFAFSDVRQSSTPIGSPTLAPASPKVGVVVFAPLANEGASANLTNVTSQQFQALFQQGELPLRVLTGVASDTTKVYPMGRNDGSGTRTTYMAESGLGITTQVNQFVATTSSGNVITVLQKVPQGGATINGSFDATSASTVWSQDADGNGGYFSGSVVKTEMGRLTNNTQVLDFDGGEILPAGSTCTLITFVSIADATGARAAGAKILGWNGVILDSLATATTLDATNLAKITEGQYSAWGFENLYYNGSLSTDENTVYSAIKTGIPTTLTAGNYAAGVPLASMHVSRPDDGAPIAP
ncbi:MAG: hypothetical protein WCK55_03645 [Verrucomicrobiota bacterium]